MFTILSLFTEDVRMSWQDEESTDEEETRERERPRTTRTRRSNSDVSAIDLADGQQAPRSPSARSHTRRAASISSTGSTVHGDDATISTPHEYRSGRRRESERAPGHGAVALAVEDATLAVIPAEAFRRLVKQYPKSSAHIVQGIHSYFTFECRHVNNLFD